jgi:uncharacterized membrane protein YdjX (TVP38/TMEM64 family)
MMADSTRNAETSRWSKRTLVWLGIGVAGTLLLLGSILYFSFSQHPLIVEYRELVRFYSSRREIKNFLVSVGPYAPPVFILLQALQVVIAPIPGEATGFLGGYVFGTWLGFLYSSVGLTLGSAAAFGLGRWLGASVVRRLVSSEVYHKFDFVARTGGELVAFILFLIPGFPKDFLCFLLGISPMPFGMFLVITSFGRMPGTWLLSIQGAKVRGAHYLEFVIFLTIAAAAALLAYNYRDRITEWLHRRDGGPRPGGDQPPEGWQA